MSESQVQQRIRGILNHPASNARAWRNNVGKRKIDGRWLTWGLAPGSGDLIGLRKILIVPEMVGDWFGQFCSWEIKNEDGGATSNDQKIWRDTIRRFGGFADIWNDPRSAEAFIAGEGLQS